MDWPQSQLIRSKARTIKLHGLRALLDDGRGVRVGKVRVQQM